MDLLRGRGRCQFCRLASVVAAFCTAFFLPLAFGARTFLAPSKGAEARGDLCNLLEALGDDGGRGRSHLACETKLLTLAHAAPAGLGLPHPRPCTTTHHCAASCLGAFFVRPLCDGRNLTDPVRLRQEVIATMEVVLRHPGVLRVLFRGRNHREGLLHRNQPEGWVCQPQVQAGFLRRPMSTQQ